MTLPADARVRATQRLRICVKAARTFMIEQDAGSAPARFEKLLAEIAKARALLAFAPASGRPAQFLEARSGLGRFQAQQALRLASELGLPELRELVLARHVMLYAHSERDVVLLALRHERQSSYWLSEPPAPWTP